MKKVNIVGINQCNKEKQSSNLDINGIKKLSQSFHFENEKSD